MAAPGVPPGGFGVPAGVGRAASLVSADDAFLRIEAALRPLLDAGTFRREVSRQNAEAFGSLPRLTWDGKERYFVLECDRLANEATAGPWIDLSLQRFDPREADGQRVEGLCGDISTARREYLERWTVL